MKNESIYLVVTLFLFLTFGQLKEAEASQFLTSNPLRFWMKSTVEIGL